MRIHTYASEQWLPGPVADVFGFFSDIGNLQTITPTWLNFEILTPRPISVLAGTLIDYRLRVHGLPVRWQTEITVWEPHIVSWMSRSAGRIACGSTNTASSGKRVARFAPITSVTLFRAAD
jgi:hypothetical protein